MPALPSVSPGERPGIVRPQPPRLRAQQTLPFLVPRPGTGPALLGEEPLGPSRNRQAQNRQARDLGAARPPPGLRPTIGCGGACAERLVSWQHLLPSHSFWLASWLPPPRWRRWRRPWAPCVASCKTSSWASRRGPLTRWLQVWQAAPRGFCRGRAGGSGLCPGARREGSEGRGDCDWSSGYSARSGSATAEQVGESLASSLKLALHSAARCSP